MAISAKLQLRQQQGLSLTPQLLQSIKLLQMNSLDLTNYIREEVEKNPILELESSDEKAPKERRNQENTAGPNSQDTDGSTAINNQQSAISSPPSERHSGDEGKLLSNPQTQYSDNYENWVAASTSMYDALLNQASMTLKDKTKRAIATEIIGSLDEDGYLRRSIDEICSAAQASKKQVLCILSKIQQFDPPGIGARNLSECMQIQLREKNRLDPAMLAMTNNLELLARRDFKKLTEICGVGHEDLIDMAHEIQELEPRPGNIFDFTPVSNVVADVIVKSKPNGSWQVELDSSTLPKVLINREYYAEIKRLSLGKNDRKFMVDSLQNANWLVASLDQRAQTILKVATEIVRQQDEFFANGPENLKPLVLRTIADEIKMHESTISRVVSSKYLSSEGGIFPFSYFFMSGLTNSDGQNLIGGQAVKYKIKQLIGEETVGSVLSDEQIAKKLQDDGIEIARRTVMKYRESLRLPSSIQRRRNLKSVN